MSVSLRRGAPAAARSPGGGPGFAPEAGAAVQVSHLRKTYGATVAVDDVSFSVRAGEIFGILGPNGAGKTTSVAFPTAQSLLVLVAWAVVFGVLAVRFFR